MMSDQGSQRRVVIIGGGFAGLFAARALRRTPVQVTLIDRAEHHLFQPLLYQCATGILSEGNITHERDGLDQVDQIVVLDHGRVAEQGSHQQLRHAGGHYQRIWESEYEYEHVC